VSLLLIQLAAAQQRSKGEKQGYLFFGDTAIVLSVAGLL